MDEDANVKKFRIVHTVIKSSRRYAYEEVQQILEDNGVKDGTGQPAPPAPERRIQGRICRTADRTRPIGKETRAQRFKNGAVKFDPEELHFDVDEKGKPIRCYFKR